MFAKRTHTHSCFGLMFLFSSGEQFFSKEGDPSFDSRASAAADLSLETGRAAVPPGSKNAEIALLFPHES